MLLGSLEGRRIAVLCGPGNNGGDGLVAARSLLDWGAEVITYLVRPAAEPARVQEIIDREGIIASADDDPGLEGLDALLTSSDLVIDAVLGIGRTRPLAADDPLGATLQRVQRARAGMSPPKLIAVDVPSGMDADTGAVDALTPAADLTVTFGLPKVGMYQAPGSAAVGRVQVIDIGIPRAATDAVALELMTARWAKTAFPKRPEDGNKGTFGRVIIVGGSRRYVGAAALAAKGAYRAGAGLVTVACPAGVQTMLAGSLAEATWLPQGEDDDGYLAEHSAIALRGEWGSFDVAVLGPGMGNVEGTRALTWAALPDLGEARRGAIIDADALNAMATFADAADRLPGNAIVTPHPGEMARLLGTSVAAVQADRMGTARSAAERLRCVVVLKGAHTVVAAPGGRTRLSPFANPLLATAGSGDVLAGLIAGYLGQGLEPFDAASLGVYVHAAAGEAMRADFGGAGALAGEIAANVPSVVKELGGPG
jgi:NAD(P)H-hydrate epimerase